VRSCDDAGEPNNLLLAFRTAMTGVRAIIMIPAPSCLNFPTDGDFDCGELSEFLVDMFFRLPSVFPVSPIYRWVFLAHARTNRLSTMMETMSG
jgi:hypothetical protein